MRIDALEEALAELKRKGVRPKFIYTIPTVQNPTGTILPEERRVALLKLADDYGVPIVEDDCYADLIWSGQRPPALYAMSKSENVIHIGSFSKSIAPALRVGFIVAPWAIMSRMLALKTDAGSGALEQMVLAEYCADAFRDARAGAARGAAQEARHADGGAERAVRHRGRVRRAARRHLPVGQAAGPGRYAEAVSKGAGGRRRHQSRPGMVDRQAHSKSRMRLCFASPSQEEIREGIAMLAEICRKEFGVPERSANISRRKG